MVSPAPPERSDGWIALKIRALLFVREEVNGTRTDVSVQDGAVTLTGFAESVEQKDLAEVIARGVQGVKSVHNEIRVHPSNATGIPAGGENEGA